ncbi:MAG: hypothetical protein HGB14_09160, partial [Anaerolineaceae bacterium]|nr:hypothetical protein [Anaerolineaceae bacterium]
MMDEVWLRARRSLVHRLEEEGFWQSLAKYETCRKEQNDLGNGIKIGIFKDILGKEDYALLNSESIFGVGNTRFRRKFPYMAAFGYKIGLIAQILNNAEIVYAKDVSEVSSIFNVGISIFDYICDEDPKKFDYLKITLLLGLLFTVSCERDLSDEAEFATFPKTAEVFIDGFSGGLEYLPFNGSKLDAFTVDETTKYDGTASMRIDVPNFG